VGVGGVGVGVVVVVVVENFNGWAITEFIV
jgi:hypothetical protein